MTITYSFPTSMPDIPGNAQVNNFSTFNATEKSAAVQALAMISSFTKITFQQVEPNDATADIRFGNASLTNVGSPPAVTYYGYGAGGLTVADVFLEGAGPNSIADDAFIPGSISDSDIGGFSWSTLLHEIGHALGLKHPFQQNAAGDPGSALPPELDHTVNSVMSYTPFAPSNVAIVNGTAQSYSYQYNSLYPTTYGLYDIAALQYLYGANTSSAGGKTFSFQPDQPIFQTFYDPGPNNTIDASALSRANRIDLTPGATSSLAIKQSLPFGVTITAQYDGSAAFSIAYGVVIANVIGGAGSDTILGNAADNSLRGGSGDDYLTGADGADLLWGETGNDTLVGDRGDDRLDGGAGLDTAIYAGPRDGVTIHANSGSGSFTITGQYGIDTISNVEVLQFSDSMTVLAASSGPGIVDRFDGLDYIASYGDLIKALGANANAGLVHFLANGFQEGRRTTFDGLSYIAAHADLIITFGENSAAGATHYINHGYGENRSSMFDANFYLAKYSDLRAAFDADTQAATRHYIGHGYFEGRSADSAGDDVLIGSKSGEYLRSGLGNDIVAGRLGNDTIDGGAGLDRAILSGARTAYTIGINPGTPSFTVTGPDGADTIANVEVLQFSDSITVLAAPSDSGIVDRFDGLNYIAIYADLIKAFGPNADAGLDHFISHGFQEGRRPTFDGLNYIASNPDLIVAYGPNAAAGATHYINYGYDENRSSDFDASFYLAKYNDLRAAFDADAQAATRHYISHGYFEGRSIDSSGNDVLVGSTSGEYLKSGGGNDSITGGLGNDTIDGGAGLDKAIFSGAPTAYTVSVNPGLESLTVRGPDGTDTIKNVEFLQFSDALTLLLAVNYSDENAVLKAYVDHYVASGDYLV